MVGRRVKCVGDLGTADGLQRYSFSVVLDDVGSQIRKVRGRVKKEQKQARGSRI